MSRSSSPPQWPRLRLVTQRVLAIDAGSRRIKLLLADSHFGRFRVRKQELLDLHAEGLVSAEETKSHLHELLDDWGCPPLALVLPQHLCISQVVDLPLAPESEVDKLIADESIKLSGVSESRIVYDFVPNKTTAKNRQQFWVTLSREGEIRERISALDLEPEELCDLTTTANALIAAFRVACPACSRAVLVHAGAQTTVLVILVAGQGAFASSFQMGGDFFTRALARLNDCREEEAETLKKTQNLFSGPKASSEFAAVVDGWVSELKRQLTEWFRENPSASSESSAFELIASGGVFDQPGLLQFLKEQAALELKPWPKGPDENEPLHEPGFEVAFGTALQALGYSPQPVSLLPEDYRLAWKKRQSRQYLDVASLALVAACVLLLALGTWHKLSLIDTKTALLAKVQASQVAVDENDALTTDLAAEYETLRPVFAAQQNTLDTLKSLALLEQSRSNRNLWYVLLADQQSYFSQPAFLTTNHPVKTNLLSFDASAPFPLGLKSASAVLTNLVAAKPGLIAELCVPGDAEAARQVLSGLVNSLKRQTLFSKADLLSDDLRRNLADPKVVVTDRDYVLSLDFAASDFQQPVRIKRPAAGLPRAGLRRPARANGGDINGEDNVMEAMP